MSNPSGSSVSFKVKSTTEELSAVPDFSANKNGVSVDELPPPAEAFAHVMFFPVSFEELPPPAVTSASPAEKLPPGVVNFASPVVLTAEKVFTMPCWFLFPRPKGCTALRTKAARNSHKPGGKKHRD
jgi:hypothetical protein